MHDIFSDTRFCIKCNRRIVAMIRSQENHLDIAVEEELFKVANQDSYRNLLPHAFLSGEFQRAMSLR